MPFWQLKNFENAGEYLRLGVPVILIMSIDWGTYEILSLLSASFGVAG